MWCGVVELFGIIDLDYVGVGVVGFFVVIF